MTGMGRKKTQMKMSQGTNARKVAPLRRRSGLFKKTRQLTTLCAVEASLVIFSPGGKAVAFHPGVESFLHHSAEPVLTNLAPTAKPDSGSTQPTQADHEASLQALDKEYHDLLEQLEAEKKRGEELQKMKMMNEQRCGRSFWNTPINELSIGELLMLKALLEAFNVEIQKHMAERSAQTSAPTEGSSVDLNGHETGPGN